MSGLRNAPQINTSSIYKIVHSYVTTGDEDSKAYGFLSISTTITNLAGSSAVPFSMSH